MQFLLFFRQNMELITFSIGFPGQPTILTIKLLPTKTLHVNSLSLGPNIIDRPVSIVSEFISLSKKSARRQPNYRATWPQWCKIFYEGAFLFARDIYVKSRKIIIYNITAVANKASYNFILNKAMKSNHKQKGQKNWCKCGGVTRRFS